MKRIKNTRAYFIHVPPEAEFEEFSNSEKRRLMMNLVYDENGNLLEDVKFDTSGEEGGRSIYRYDVKNRRISEETYDADGNLEEKLTFEYDAEGKVVKSYVHYLDDSKDTIAYQYNSDGKLTSKIWTNDEGETERIEKFVYNGDLLISEEMTEEGELVRKNVFEYDEKGKMTGADFSDEEEDYTTAHEYDDKGNLVKTLKYDADEKLIGKEVNYYDEHNNRIKVNSEQVKGKTELRMAYRENKMIASVEQEFSNTGQLQQQIERALDEDGNLLELRVFQTGAGQYPLRKYLVVYEYESLLSS
jgi:YD repeat-containing protein